MRPSRLSDHKLVKGKFITPLHSIPQMTELPDEKSWSHGRLPEYLWIGLILNKYGRTIGLQKAMQVMSILHETIPDIHTPRISCILSAEANIQQEFYKKICDVISKNTLSPLTIVLTTSKYPIFSKWFYDKDTSIIDRINKIIEILKENLDHQTNKATDIRFLIVYFQVVSGKMHLLDNMLQMLSRYPITDHASDIMCSLRPMVRAAELSLLEFETINYNYLENFWRCISEMTECEIYVIEFPQEKVNLDLYMEQLYEVFKYLSNLFISTNPLNEKMKVILGIATYSYKRIKEAYEHNLFNSISGRSCIRILIENYIMLKYLINQETDHPNIWSEYQIYGLGQYKLILTKYRDSSANEKSHFDYKYIEAIVNEYRYEEFIDMDTKYFNSDNIRIKAEKVGEKDLYGLYYDYDSSYEHGLWGAIRETSLLKCINPAHQYHCVPDIDDNIVLKSVLPDCIMVMKKTIEFLNEIYGIPDNLFDEVINFEI